MKKALVFVLALSFGSIAFAISCDDLANKSCTTCPVYDNNHNLVYCDNLYQNPQPGFSTKNCCWKTFPLGSNTGIIGHTQDQDPNWNGGRGGKGGKSGAKDGFPQSVCEKLTYPQIIHRPRCEESKHCKIYPHLRHCEDLYGNETHGKLVACCWVGPQPTENGGRGGKGGKADRNPHFCEGQWANLPQCTGPWPTSKVNEKCCWPISYKGGAKGSKPAPKAAPKAKADKVKAPAAKTAKAEKVKPAEAKKAK